MTQSKKKNAMYFTQTIHEHKQKVLMYKCTTVILA